MKELAAAVYAFFLVKASSFSRCCSAFPVVRMISPKNKFSMKSLFDIDEPELFIGGDASRSYRERKLFSVRAVHRLMESSSGTSLRISDAFKAKFSSAKKKDDLSDCLLLSWAAIKKFHILTH
jgi:hypothetical protein